MTGGGDPKIKCLSCGEMVVLRDHVRLVAGMRWLDCPECSSVHELVLGAPNPADVDLRETSARDN